MPLERLFPETNLRFAYFDEAAFADAHAEVFGEDVYRFEASNSAPYILDCGANLGLASCYFKSRYPKAEIVAFEPDPRMQELFRRNTVANGFTDIRLECCALSGKEGVARFHGDLTSMTPHALGNSLVPEWGLQQTSSSGIEVPTKMLSPFLNRTVDLLKLDIEGAELEVLRECESKLGVVREIRMEIHETMSQPDMCREIVALLKRAGFTTDVEERPLQCLLPQEAMPWFEEAQPKLFILRGTSNIQRGR